MSNVISFSPSSSIRCCQCYSQSFRNEQSHRPKYRFSTFSETHSPLDLTRTTFIFVFRREQLYSFEFTETSDKSVSPFVKISSTRIVRHSFSFIICREKVERRKEEQRMFVFATIFSLTSKNFIIDLHYLTMKQRWFDVRDQIFLLMRIVVEPMRLVDGKNSSNCFLRTNHQRKTRREEKQCS